MMMNLFAIFEPSTSKNFSLNWLALFIPMVLYIFDYWLVSSRMALSMKMIMKSIMLDFKNNFKQKNLKTMMFFVCLFWMILIWNFMGLNSYIFTPTSHLSITLNLAFPLWLTLMLYGWLINMNDMFSHLIPAGTPLMLSVFMVFIETISSLIRPITLSVRLAANMIAGHLLITLLSNISEALPSMYIFTLPVLLALYMLEIAVSIIQSYVFLMLCVLYYNEIN